MQAYTADVHFCFSLSYLQKNEMSSYNMLYVVAAINNNSLSSCSWILSFEWDKKKQAKTLKSKHVKRLRFIFLWMRCYDRHDNIDL